MSTRFVIVMPLYEDVNLFDVAAPRELFGWWSNMDRNQEIELVCVAKSAGEIETYSPNSQFPGLKIVAEKSFSDIESADLLWVPGGSSDALKREMENADHMRFLKRIAADATYVTSVCEGALLLAKAGLLNGFKATTHWAFLKCLSQFPEIDVIPDPNSSAPPEFPRFIVDDHGGELTKGIRSTGGGISSAVDESLELIRIIGGTEIAKSIQRVTQYFPSPPVTADPLNFTECQMGVLVKN